MTSSIRSLSINKGPLFVSIVLVLLLTAAPSKAADEWFQDWQLESPLRQSHLVLVARVATVSELRVVEGAKTNTTLREYRFQPVQLVKGVFSREELAMTGADLGFPSEDGSSPPPLKQGELRLLLLTRGRRSGFVGCGTVSRERPFEQRMPLLSASDDAIAQTAATLVRVQASRSRQEQVQILVARLQEADGPEAVPLLQSLQTRAFMAAQNPEVADPLVRLAAHESVAIRSSAIHAIERVLSADYLHRDTKAHGAYADVLRKLLESDFALTKLRVAALTALSRLPHAGERFPWASALLLERLREGQTYAERDAAATAVAELNLPGTGEAVLRSLEDLPLDEENPREKFFATVAARTAPEKIVDSLLQRLQKSLAAGQSVTVEAEQLGELGARNAVPFLLQAARSGDLERSGRLVLARSFVKLRDPRTVPVLAEWLGNERRDLRSAALDGLSAIGNDPAVAAVGLRLKQEPHLRLKLRMAEMLGRNGIQDGYSVAIEHLADSGYTELASGALGAIKSARTSEDLLTILENSHDLTWSAAALSGLLAVRDPVATEKLFVILADQRHPLLATAVKNAGKLGDRRALPLLTSLITSRNTDLASAALRSIDPLLQAGAAPGDSVSVRDIATACLGILQDPYAAQELRVATLHTLSLTGDARLADALKSLVDQSELRGSALFARVEAETRRQGIVLR